MPSAELQQFYRRYNRLLTLKLLEVIPKKYVKFVLLGRQGNLRRYFWERLGCWPKEMRRDLSSQKDPWIWCHANAIGEVLAAQGFISDFRRRHPGWRVLLTTMNDSADEMARKRLGADITVFFPYDVPFLVSRLLRRVAPKLFIIFEADLWPNTIRLCKERGIPVVVVNGRFVPARVLYNHRVPFVPDVLRLVDFFCMESEVEAQRLGRFIGNGKSNLAVCGNLKSAQARFQCASTDLSRYRSLFGLDGTEEVLVAGSTHAVEDEEVLSAFITLKASYPRAVLILAPRYLDRVEALEKIVASRGLVSRLRTQLLERPRSFEDVVLVDTYGELPTIYALGTVCFVGGSLVPEWAEPPGFHHEGHNPLEPAFHGKPVLFGPRMGNFESLAHSFLESGAGCRVGSGDELAACTRTLFADKERLQEMSQEASRIVERQGDALERTMEHVERFLS